MNQAATLNPLGLAQLRKEKKERQSVFPISEYLIFSKVPAAGLQLWNQESLKGSYPYHTDLFHSQLYHLYIRIFHGAYSYSYAMRGKI